MTEICREIIDHPSAWTSRSVGGKESLAYPLSERQLDAVDEVLARTRHKKPQEVTRREFDHPALAEPIAGIRDIITDGRGLVIVQGPTRERYSEEDFERIYWGIGTHLGIAVVQSSWGDRLGHVRYEPEQKVVRAYRSLGELQLHNDAHEIVGLMSVQRAETGGFSRLASGIAVHNEILRTRPDLLEPLYRPFHRYVYETKSPTDLAVPSFCYVEGKLSCRYSYAGMKKAAEAMGTTLPPEVLEANEYFFQIMNRDDIRFEFLLEPGEMALWNDFVVLHARTSFENSAERQRHLLRLWLDVPNGRPVTPVFLKQDFGPQGKAKQEAAAAASATA